MHITAATQAVENLKFMFLPRERRARVPVPVALWGEEGAPGVKGGGWLHVVNRTVPFVCEGWAVVPRIELDVRRMQVPGGMAGWTGLWAGRRAQAVAVALGAAPVTG